MNSFDNDKVRSIELSRRRLENARSDVARWRCWSVPILASLEAARRLCDIADIISTVGDSPSTQVAQEAAERLEHDIANVFAVYLGVDILAAIKAEAEAPAIRQGEAVYLVAPGIVQTLPNGWNVRPVDDGPAWSMTEAEAQTAFEAIAWKRLRHKCECDDSVGFQCRRCKRDAKRDDVDATIRRGDVVYRWARIMVKKRKVR